MLFITYFNFFMKANQRNKCLGKANILHVCVSTLKEHVVIHALQKCYDLETYENRKGLLSQLKKRLRAYFHVLLM